ncbi:MAG: TrmB family transcriptional regulator [Candidatus Hodarchaeota archaeon]
MVSKGRITQTLKELGLSDYEARSYYALIILGPSNASEIAQEAGVPPTSMYKILERLQGKGWIEISHGRPKIYKAVDPRICEKAQLERIEEVFAELTKRYMAAPSHEKSQLIFTISGEKNVLNKIGDMLDRTEGEFILMAPNAEDITKKLDKKFRNANERNVRITVITHSDQRIPEFIERKNREPLEAIDIVSDNNESMISMPDYSICGWVKSPQLTKHVRKYLRTAAVFTQ